MSTVSRLALLWGCAVVLLAGAAFAAGPPQAQYHQDYFVISFWGDPPVDNLVNQRYAEVSAAHFNVALGGMGADTPDKAKKQRDACKKYNLKVIFSTYGLPVDQLCNCETTYGFLIRDHPATSDFAAVRSRIDDVRRLRPGKLPLVNLFPDTASAADMGADSYEDYVDRFLAAVGPEVLCFDHYPSFPPETDGRASYCKNLALIRSAALDQRIPFWCFVKAMPYGSDAVPTEAQIRWQVYAALAHGARGILYSCYATPPAGNGFRGTGLIGPDDKPTERYAQVARINAALGNLENTLMRMTSTGVWHLVPGGQAAADAPVTITGTEDSDEFLVGAFARKGSGTAVLVMNYAERGADAVPTVAFAAPAGKVTEVSKKSASTAAVKDEDPSLNGLQLTFAPGDGRLFLVEEQ